MAETLLEVKDLQVDFLIEKTRQTAVHEITFNIEKGRTLAVVGESGCGKSVTASAILRLLPKDTSDIPKGSIKLNGEDILTMSDKRLREIRGGKIAMIFQDPMTALNPVHTIGNQMIEMLRLHNKMSKEEAYRKSIELLDMVGIPLPGQRMEEYPHELSGGLRQRVMIAMAMSCEPELLIADEPTTALDVTIQAQILDQMRQLKEKSDMAIMLITHDMGVVAEMADDVVVMYAGEIVEFGSAEDIFDHPKHPYTKGLLKAIPRLDIDDEGELYTINGTVPALNEFTDTCRFANRCPYACDECSSRHIDLTNIDERHTVRCCCLDKVEAEAI